MASRTTQVSKAQIAAPAATNARVTQTSKAQVWAGNASLTTARVSQVSRVIIATIPLTGDKRMLKGMGV